MKVIVAMDGSKYGQWGLNWVAKLPLVKAPRVTALHVLDSAWPPSPHRHRNDNTVDQVPEVEGNGGRPEIT